MRSETESHLTETDLILLIFTKLLLGRFRFGVPFRDAFSISVALSLGVVLRLNKITPGGDEARVVGINARQKLDNKNKTIKTILSAVLPHLKIFYR